MPSSEFLRTEVTHYLILSDQLKAAYGEIDDETVADTLEGISELPDMILEVVRSGLEDDMLLKALKSRIEEMQARLERFKLRSEKKRELASWAMGAAGIPRLQGPDFSVSLRQANPHLEILDEQVLPSDFLVPQPPKLDRAGIISRLKAGDSVPGAMLAYGQPHITVRVR